MNLICSYQCHHLSLFSYLLLPPPSSTLFPYTTLFRSGVNSARMAIETCARLKLEALTLYAFSVENWRRPKTEIDRKSTRLNSSHITISYAVFCLKKK